MAYKTKEALLTFDSYTQSFNFKKEEIEDTKKCGFVVTSDDGEKFVIFIYPLVHKQDNSKNYFDTRDSGAYERSVAWKYAKENGLKYFCFGVNDKVNKYQDYIFSLECKDDLIEKLSGTKNGVRNGPGNQIIIPNDYVPKENFERIKNRAGIYISAIKKDELKDYIEKYDNRPYQASSLADLTQDGNSVDDTPINYYTGLSSEFERNRILFGAPGTGKSYTLNKELKDLIGADNDNDYERVTFHPDYSYANFVGTYKPVPSEDEEGNETITYKYVPGPFMRVYAKALKNAQEANPKPFVLVIEEINRANVAAVFGDIFQLLDRGENGVSEYPIEASEDIKAYLSENLGGSLEKYSKIRIPDNMFIWATMNSADQGVFPMDTAFKRRWDFTYLGINDNDEKIQGKYVDILGNGSQIVEWNKLRKAINDYLANEKINEDKQLGPYFISKNIVVPDSGDEIDRTKFNRVFKNKVIMYLFEDAAKQKRARVFDGCPDNSRYRYSEICREFTKNGIEIFNKEIKNEAEPKKGLTKIDSDINDNQQNSVDTDSNDFQSSSTETN